MLDKFGRQLKPGDKVTIQADVAALYPTEPLINLKSASSNRGRPTTAANTATAFTSTRKP